MRNNINNERTKYQQNLVGLADRLTCLGTIEPVEKAIFISKISHFISSFHLFYWEQSIRTLYTIAIINKTKCLNSPSNVCEPKVNGPKALRIYIFIGIFVYWIPYFKKGELKSRAKIVDLKETKIVIVVIIGWVEKQKN